MLRQPCSSKLPGALSGRAGPRLQKPGHVTRVDADHYLRNSYLAQGQLSKVVHTKIDRPGRDWPKGWPEVVVPEGSECSTSSLASKSVGPGCRVISFPNTYFAQTARPRLLFAQTLSSNYLPPRLCYAALLTAILLSLVPEQPSAG